MQIIALIGPNSCGKTTTLNLVYDELINNLEATIFTIVTPKQPNINNKDFECIFNYQNKKVAFYTMGDYSRITINKINCYNAKNVDILIIATNDKFKNPIKKINSYNNVIINKTIANPKNSINILSANIGDRDTIINHL